VEIEDALEAYLKTAPYNRIRDLRGGGGGGHHKKVLTLRGGVNVVAKPNDTPENEKQAHNEVAAWLLAVEMGLTDIAPATVLRPVPAPGGGEIEGSAQVEWPGFVRAEQNFRHTDCPDDRAWQIVVFDAVAANTDRNDGNWGAVIQLPDAVLCDHGRCFTYGASTTSPFFQDRHGQAIPAHVMVHMEAFLHTSDSTRLREMLDDLTVDQTIARAQHLVQEGKLVLP
jgi:hypothetical protein